MLSSKFLISRKKIAWNNIIEIASFAVFSGLFIRRRDFDIVHTQGRSLGGADIVTAHSCHAESLKVLRNFRTGIFGKLKKTVINPLHFILLSLERINIAKTRKIIAVSEAVKSEIVKHYKVPQDKVTVVYNGVNVEKFSTGSETAGRDHVRGSYGIKDSNKTIIFAANEFERKGLAQIIEAHALIGMKNLFVLVMGEDDPSGFGERIKELGLEKNFIFTGRVACIQDCFLAADMLVHPASYEPFGLVVTEAMAAGLPVIVSKVTGAAELITDGENGILLQDCFNAGEIAQAIKRVLNDPAGAGKMGEMARKTAKKHSWEAIASSTFRLYEKAVSEQSVRTFENHGEPARHESLRQGPDLRNTLN